MLLPIPSKKQHSIIEMIANLKSAQSTRMSWQQLATGITQAMSCMYIGTKKSSVDNIPTSWKPFLGISRPSELAKVIDGSLDLNLTF